VINRDLRLSGIVAVDVGSVYATHLRRSEDGDDRIVEKEHSGADRVRPEYLSAAGTEKEKERERESAKDTMSYW
jgi:hypothetical protein